MNIEAEVSALIQEELSKTASTYSFAQLDSLDVIRLILAIESRFDINLELSELSPSNLGSQSDLVRFIASKK